MVTKSLDGLFYILTHWKKRPSNDGSAVIITELFKKVQTGQLMTAQASLVGFLKLIDIYGRKHQSDNVITFLTILTYYEQTMVW